MIMMLIHTNEFLKYTILRLLSTCFNQYQFALHMNGVQSIAIGSSIVDEEIEMLCGGMIECNEEKGVRQEIHA